MTFFDFQVQVGSSYAYTGTTTTPTIGKYTCSNFSSNAPLAATISGTYTVSSGNQTLCYGMFLNTTQATGIAVGTTQLNATRIA